MNVYPVIHHLHYGLSLDQARKAFDSNANGIFLISPHGRDYEILLVAKELKKLYPDKHIGINYLNEGVIAAFKHAVEFNLDMVWGDFCGVSSKGLDATGQELKNLVNKNPEIKVFCSVAFKYQPIEKDPAAAAKIALQAGFIPTTSGSATGQAPSLEKIKAMSGASNGVLAVASGMNKDNIESFKPYLSEVLIASGISLNEFEIDEVLFKEFMATVSQ